MLRGIWADIKDTVPNGGYTKKGLVQFAVRVHSKLIKDGSFYTDVLVRDVDGEVVALSQRVSMIVSL